MTFGFGEGGKRGKRHVILIGMPMVQNVSSFFDFDTTISNDELDFNNNIYLTN
jgi:hypothetical protein